MSDITAILTQHAKDADDAVIDAWHAAKLESQATLFATGAYGLGQRYCHSDLDLLIVYHASNPQQEARFEQESLPCFLQSLWRQNHTLGYRISTPHALKHDAPKQWQDDSIWASTCMSARWLAGQRAFLSAVRPKRHLDLPHFIQAKMHERALRHQRHASLFGHHGAYHLKNMPGGLRDIADVQLIAHVLDIRCDAASLAQRFLKHDASVYLETISHLMHWRETLHRQRGRDDNLLLAAELNAEMMLILTQASNLIRPIESGLAQIGRVHYQSRASFKAWPHDHAPCTLPS